MKGIFVDTETGGLTPATDALCSVAVVSFDLSLPIDECLISWDQELICVPMDSKLSVHPKALAVQGLTRERLVSDFGRLPERAAIENIAVYLYRQPKQFSSNVWAWNAPFDAGFLGEALTRSAASCDPLDARSMLCARQFAMCSCAAGQLPGPISLRRGVPQRLTSLSAWAQFYGMQQPEPHDALADAQLGAKVLWHLVRAMEGVKG